MTPITRLPYPDKVRADDLIDKINDLVDQINELKEERKKYEEKRN